MVEPQNAQTISLAVLPFDGIPEKSDFEHLVCGFSEELIFELSRYSGMQIISSYTSRLLGDGDTDIFESAQEIEIDYLLKGSIRFSADTLRIHTQLLNTETRNVLWAERYDVLIDSFFEVQDRIVEQVVFAIQTEVEHNLLSVARKKTTTDLKIYDCWLRGMAKLSHGTVESDQEARAFFHQAIELDPNCSRAYAGLSLSHFNEWSCQLWELYEESQDHAYRYATRAVQIDDTDHIVHMILGRIYIYRRQFDEAEYHIEKSLTLNSSDADNLIQLATCMAFLGRVADGERLVKKALLLNPYRNLWYYQYGSFVYFVKKSYEESIEMALKRQLARIWVDLPGYIAAAHAYLGRSEEARSYMEMFKGAFQASIIKGRTPTAVEMLDWVKKANPFKHESDTNNLVEGLLLAGLDKQRSGTILIQKKLPVVESVSIFKKEQAIWRIQFEGLEITLTNMKGLQDICRLLDSPEVDVHVTELMGAESSMDEASFTIDEKARQAYKQHLQDLKDEISEAEEYNDLGRITRLKKEHDQVVDHLTKALGAGRRPRKLKSSAERARAAVTLRIKNAIKRIAALHAPLGKHLSNSIRTGVYCRYSPEEWRQWIVG